MLNHKPLDMTIKSTGDAGLVEQAGKRAYYELEKLSADFRKEKSTLGLPATRMTDWIASDPVVAHEKISRAIELTRKYLPVIAAWNKRSHDALVGLPVTAWTRDHLLKGLDYSIHQDASLAERDLNWDIKVKLETDSMARDLIKSQGKYRFENGKLLFDDSEALKAYQSHIAAVDKLVSEAEKFKK